MTSRFSGRSTGDTGFTLVEVVVALFLVSILGTIVASVTIQATRSTDTVSERAEVQSDLTDALMRVNGHISHADGFTVTTPTELVLSSTDPDTTACTLIRYQVTADSALTVTRAVCSTTPVWEQQQTVVTNLDASVSPFTYYALGGETVSPADPATVQRVQVRLTVGTQTMVSSTAQREADDIQLVF